MHWTAHDRNGNPVDGNGAPGIPAGDLAAMLAAKGHTDIRIGGHAVAGPVADVNEADDEPLVDASAYQPAAAAPCKGHRTDHGPHYRPGRSYCVGPCDGSPDGDAAKLADEPVTPTRRRRDKAPAAAAPEPTPDPAPDNGYPAGDPRTWGVDAWGRYGEAVYGPGRAVDEEVLNRGRARDAERDAKRDTEPTPDERADQQAVIAAARKLAKDKEHGGVHMADLRAALPDMPPERFEDAVHDLHHRPDVYMYPDTSQANYFDLDRRRQGVSIGPSNDTALDVRPQDVSVDGVVSVVRAADRRRTATALDGVPDYMLDNVAERIGAPVGDTPEQTRANIVDTSVDNDRRQHAQWEQQRLDGTLLHRADNEPEWVATWTDDDRAAARSAAARAAADTEWEDGAARGRRWLETLDAN